MGIIEFYSSKMHPSGVEKRIDIDKRKLVGHIFCICRSHRYRDPAIIKIIFIGGLMNDERIRVCPVEHAGSLDGKVRKWIQNPRKILAPYISEGMTVLDFGCGPGFFSVEMAHMVGPKGRVISADLQEGMLQIVKSKIQGTELENRITLTKCASDDINVTEKLDFAMAFFVVHEVPDKERLFNQIKPLLKEEARFFLVEPKLFHVSKSEFGSTLRIAQTAGFKIDQGPRLPFCWSAILNRR